MDFRYLLFLSIAACNPPRPDTNICIVNAPNGNMKCYNLKEDYTDEGNLKPDASPSYTPLLSVLDINKYACTDPDGLSNLKVYIRELRTEYDAGCGAKIKEMPRPSDSPRPNN